MSLTPMDSEQVYINAMLVFFLTMTVGALAWVTANPVRERTEAAQTAFSFSVPADQSPLGNGR